VLCLALAPDAFERPLGGAAGQRLEPTLPAGAGRRRGAPAADGRPDDPLVFARTNAGWSTRRATSTRRPAPWSSGTGASETGPGGTYTWWRDFGYPPDDPRVVVIDPIGL